MTIIIILFIISALIGVFYVIKKFNNHCMEKFGYAFFTKESFGFCAIGYILIFVGFYWYNSSKESNGDISNPIVLTFIGGLILSYIIWINIRKTNITYGVGGTLIQFPLFGVLSYFGFFVFIAISILYVFLSMISVAGSTPVYVVNKN